MCSVGSVRPDWSKCTSDENAKSGFYTIRTFSLHSKQWFTINQHINIIILRLGALCHHLCSNCCNILHKYSTYASISMHLRYMWLKTCYICSKNKEKQSQVVLILGGVSVCLCVCPLHIEIFFKTLMPQICFWRR